MQNIYACLAQPSEHLTVSYPVTDHNGGQLRPSFVVRRLERLFPGLMPERETVRLLTPAVALEEAGQEMGGSLSAVLSRERGVRRDAGGHGAGQTAAPGTAVPSGGAVPVRHPDGDVRIPDGPGAAVPLRLLYAVRPAGQGAASGRFEAPGIGTFLHYLRWRTPPVRWQAAAAGRW